MLGAAGPNSAIKLTGSGLPFNNTFYVAALANKFLGSDADAAMTALDSLVRERISARASARSARDWATADAIRDQLAEAGVAIEDTAAGARWSLARMPQKD